MRSVMSKTRVTVSMIGAACGGSAGGAASGAGAGAGAGAGCPGTGAGAAAAGARRGAGDGAGAAGAFCDRATCGDVKTSVADINAARMIRLICMRLSPLVKGPTYRDREKA